jgi:hypothetical protein
VARTGRGLVRYVDLPEALAALPDAPADEWRIHFHAPVFLEELGPFRSTQPFLREILALQAREPIAPHLEVETYTWDVLPQEFRSADVVDDVVRELSWVRERLAR